MTLSHVSITCSTVTVKHSFKNCGHFYPKKSFFCSQRILMEECCHLVVFYLTKYCPPPHLSCVFLCIGRVDVSCYVLFILSEQMYTACRRWTEGQNGVEQAHNVWKGTFVFVCNEMVWGAIFVGQWLPALCPQGGWKIFLRSRDKVHAA